MPPLGLYLAFLGACAVLCISPGPNLALIMARTLTHGQRAGFVTLLGTWSGSGVLLAIVVAGLATVAATLADVMNVVRWVGAAYLIVQGVVLLLGHVDTTSAASAPRHASLLLHGFLTGVANPKLLVFFAAFLPQFVSTDRPALPQFAVLGVTFMAVIFVGDGIWILGANRLRRFAKDVRVTQRIAGVLMIGAGAGFALVRRS